MNETDFVHVPEWGYGVTTRKIVCRHDDFVGSYNLTRLEDGQVLAFAHLDVWDFGPSTLKAMREAWTTHRPSMPNPLFALFDEDTPARDRFAKRLGFFVVSKVPCSDGNDRTLYAHYL